jgi:predicted amidophosphoribosyltransferase
MNNPLTSFFPALYERCRGLHKDIERNINVKDKCGNKTGYDTLNYCRHCQIWMDKKYNICPCCKYKTRKRSHRWGNSKPYNLPVYLLK